MTSPEELAAASAILNQYRGKTGRANACAYNQACKQLVQYNRNLLSHEQHKQVNSFKESFYMRPKQRDASGI